MNELIGNLVKNADIDEATAKKVIGIVKDFLEDKLPSPIDSQVANVLDGVDAEDVEGALNKLKGFLK